MGWILTNDLRWYKPAEESAPPVLQQLMSRYTDEFPHTAMGQYRWVNVPTLLESNFETTSVKPQQDRWITWFDAQTKEDQRTIALAAVERLMDVGLVAFWSDDVVDKFGDDIPEGRVVGEHLHWTEAPKEDLRIPF